MHRVWFVRYGLEEVDPRQARDWEVRRGSYKCQAEAKQRAGCEAEMTKKVRLPDDLYDREEKKKNKRNKKMRMNFNKCLSLD